MKRLLLALFCLAWMAGCSSEPAKPPEKPQPKAPEYLTGRSAFQKMFISARGWARDAQPFRLESQPTSDAKGQDGKSAVWRASFASPAQHGAKPWTWSGTDAPDAPPRGVNPGSEDNYNPNNASTSVFDMQFLKVDSDKAFETAQKHGGEKILQKDPDTPIIYILDWSRPTNELVWHVYYGPSRDQAKLRAQVNATTGEFIRLEK
ncbi:MAG TPA: hypothetical protein VFA68_02795 [Terriglobales bacterium]|nr:hypothetical protein [Terriglobales bacterium]